MIMQGVALVRKGAIDSDDKCIVPLCSGCSRIVINCDCSEPKPELVDVQMGCPTVYLDVVRPWLCSTAPTSPGWRSRTLPAHDDSPIHDLDCVHSHPSHNSAIAAFIQTRPCTIDISINSSTYVDLLKVELKSELVPLVLSSIRILTGSFALPINSSDMHLAQSTVCLPLGIEASCVLKFLSKVVGQDREPLRPPL